jgi:hypothetical protein
VSGVEELFIYGSWLAPLRRRFRTDTPGDIDVLVLGRRDPRCGVRRRAAGRRAAGSSGEPNDPIGERLGGPDDGFARQVRASSLFGIEGAWRT